MNRTPSLSGASHGERRGEGQPRKKRTLSRDDATDIEHGGQEAVHEGELAALP